METRHAVILASLTSLATLACSGSQAVRLNQSDPLPEVRWQGSVTSPPTLDGVVEMSGTAWMAESQESDSATVVQVAIQNAAPGGLHPWEVRRGQCGSSAVVLGESTAYQPLEVSNEGRATASATVNEPLPETGVYSVAILASPSNEELIVACANLAPPVAAGFR